ncbi:hypothetical protein CEY12_00190 [Chryseobacterium sp. T16E-39]|uniref:hypothetical protein n=1 Tax=Chryseobacterium sp. T16E-39 TaxID=2015076 RepID=UPI000B5B3636|nr:hypothetical protein [Chryseobacterium sp. T16E-39]ASK28619.1 hypothetical protein CEY12_00190 [Chryseobacterium sp. T16E-39]
MKLLILLAMTLYSSFLLAQETNTKGIQGDYDGNGTKEYAYIKINDCTEECDGKCETVVYFSDKNIKSFTVSQANGVELYNLGDLNGDGKDDIGTYTLWCTSCWAPFSTYTYNKTGWKALVKPITTHCSQWEADKFPIKKDPKKKGNVIITSSEWKDDDIKIVTKSVKVN